MTTTGHATSADGTRVGWEQWGAGPALVVVHGGARMGKHYRALAEALADRFTVVLPDRRGRGLSGPPGPGDALEAELADLAAVQAATGAELVLGHSAGGAIALEAALRRPPRQLALYEPAVSLEGSLPLDWVPAFEQALSAGRDARAFAVFAKGLQMGPPTWLPAWLLELPLRLLMRQPEGREMAALLRTLPRDLSLVIQQDARASRYAALRCPTLLLGGAQSPGYLLRALEVLGTTIPGARRVVLPGVGHNAPDLDAPAAVAAQLRAFFAPA